MINHSRGTLPALLALISVLTVAPLAPAQAQWFRALGGLGKTLVEGG
jgi:hypothetical protein